MPSVHRRVGAVADALGVPRPSYQQVWVTVHDLRAQRRSAELGQLLLDVTLSTQTKAAILRAIDELS